MTQTQTATPASRSGNRIGDDERLIVALDVSSASVARDLVDLLGDDVVFYKIGLGLFMTGDGFGLIEWLRARGKKVFLDLKFFDVPETVRSAVARLRAHDVQFVTVHGNDAMLKAAIEAAATESAGAGGTGIKVLAVTALTSLDKADMDDLGFRCSVEELVLSRARRALALGCAGVVSSGLEAPAIREMLRASNECDTRAIRDAHDPSRDPSGGARGFVIVTPGIRPTENKPNDDQKRTVDVAQAFENGADYIVVGRPIIRASDPKSVARKMREQIACAVAQVAA